MMKTIIRSLKMTLPLSLLLPVAIALVIANVRAQESSSPSAGNSPAKSETTTTKSESTTQKADTEWDGVRVELTSVTRGDGDTITIKFKYTNSGSKAAKISELGQFGGDNMAAHIYYVDGKNKKKYLVVKDAEGNAVASTLRYLEIEAGASRGGWAKFPAPPAGVDKITVYLPGAPPFESVTISAP
jgi:hypothetical protein